MKISSSLILIISINLLSGMDTTFAQAPEIEWENSFGGSSSDVAHSIQRTTDDGFIFFGESRSNDGDVTGNQGDSDYWLVKLNEVGNLEWQKSLGGSGLDYGKNGQQTLDGGYIICGNSNSNDGDVLGNHGTYDYWIVKLTVSGSIQWAKTIGGSEADSANDVDQTQDGGYMIAGSSNSNDGDVSGNHGLTDFWIVKMNAAGDIEAQNSFGGSGMDYANDIQSTMDGGYIIAGSTDSNDGDVIGHQGEGDFWIVKISLTGSMVWQKTLGGTANESANSIKQTPDGGYIVAGASDSNDGDVSGNQGDSDVWVVKLSTTGDLEWQKSFGGSAYDAATEVQIVNNGYVISGFSSSNDGDVTGHKGAGDFWVIKFSESGELLWEKTMGGSNEDGAYAIQQTPDHGFIVAGSAYSNDGDVTGNQGVSDCWIVKLEPDPLSVEAFENPISIYPNPVSSVLNISADAPVKSVSVFNQVGQLVISSSHYVADIQLKVSELPPNLYFVVVETEKAVETFKIIIR